MYSKFCFTLKSIILCVNELETSLCFLSIVRR